VDARVGAEKNRVPLLLEVVAGRLDFAPRLTHNEVNLLPLRRGQLQNTRHSLERPLARNWQQTIAIDQGGAAKANR